MQNKLAFTKQQVYAKQYKSYTYIGAVYISNEEVGKDTENTAYATAKSNTSSVTTKS